MNQNVFLGGVEGLLLDDFSNLARARVDSVNPQERAETPSKDVYDRMLASLHLVASQAPEALLNGLLAWRKTAIEFDRAEDPYHLRKRLAAECAFLEAAQQVMDPGASRLSDKHCQAIEKLAFDWVIRKESYVGSQYAQQPEILQARNQVVLLCGRLIGTLSAVHLQDISSRFFSEVDKRVRSEKPADRSELLQLCEGMHHVRLPAGTTAEVQAATAFLDRAHPLNYVAPIRKSSVQHAFCDMLIAILGACVKADVPRSRTEHIDPAAMRAWNASVNKMRGDIQTWTVRQSKHSNYGWPLTTLLTCLLDDQSFLGSFDGLLDNLHRLLKDKLVRTMTLTWLWQIINAYLVRFAANSPRERLRKVLEKSTKPILVALRKGSFAFTQQLDVVRSICVTVAYRVPDFGIGSLIFELVHAESANWDASLTGLRALLTVLLDAPKRTSFASDFSPSLVAGDGAGAAQSPELLAMLRAGNKPLEVYGDPRMAANIARALSSLLQACDKLYASFTIMRPMTDPALRERAPGLAVFGMALRCMPYVLPTHWTGDRMAQDLPSYTVNMDANIRRLAAEVMHRVVRGLPHMRNTLLQGLVSFISRLSDDHPEVLREGLVLLISLMKEWVTILDEIARGQVTEASTPAALQFEVARVEGLALCCMCSISEGVRARALEALGAASVLDGALLTCRSRVAGGPGQEAGVPMFVGDVIDEMGPDHARRCYWDFGPWAVLWRSWRPPDEEPVAFEDLLRKTRTSEDQQRWARCLSEVAKSAAPLCPAAARAACLEVCTQLQGLLPRDLGTRTSLTGDAASEPGPLGDLIRCYSCVACAIAPSTLKGHPANQMQKDLLHSLASIIRLGPESLQQVAVVALGNCSPELYEALFGEMQALIDDYNNDRQRWTQSVRGRIRREDVRALVAQVFGLVAANMPPGTLLTSTLLRTRLIEFASDTLRYLANNTSSEALLEALNLRFQLSVVVRTLALQLGQAMQAVLTPALRRSLFEALLPWTEDGPAPDLDISGKPRSDWQGPVKIELARAQQAARSRLKDLDAIRTLDADSATAAEHLEHAARTAMAALLLGPGFDADVTRPKARVALWINRLLTAELPTSLAARPIASLGPSKQAVARSALLSLLSTNPELAGVFADQCYDATPVISRVYFQVLAEVNATQQLGVARHVMLSLVLHKIVDTSQEVRDDALHMLGVLSRSWREGAVRGAAPGAAVEGVVIGNLQDSCQQFQYQLSAKLARDHPEVAEALCVEMMTRQLNSAGKPSGLQHQVLSCLVPWMQVLSLSPRWKGTWMEDLMKSMLFVTREHGAAFAHEIERLWTTVASNKHNIIPILEFLISWGLQEMHSGDTESHLNVSKRISLFLARKSPQHTIDTLVYEIKKMQEDDDALATPKAHRHARAVEFHHPKPLLARQASIRAGPSMRVPGLGHAPSSQSSFHLPLSLLPQPIAALPQHLGHGLAAIPGVILPDFVQDTTGGLGHLLSGKLHKVGDLIKQGTLRTEQSGSFTTVAGTPARISSLNGNHSPDSSRRSSYALYQPPSPVARGALTRAEMALCLLAEVAWEHDEDLRLHLPELLHASMVTLDSPEPLVSKHALLAIVHLLYSLSVRHLELSRAGGAMVLEYERVRALIQHLQALRGRRLWAYEDASLAQPRLPSAEALRQLVGAMLASIFFESDLGDRWAATALEWLRGAHSRHLSCRSHQVFRALRPKVSGEACSTMLTCLHKCLTAEGSPTALDVAVDVILTLQAMVEGMTPGRLVMFPQLLLAALALLPVSYVHVFTLVLDLLSKILDQLDLTDCTVQNVLLATVPPLPQNSVQKLAADSPWELGMGLFPSQGLLAVQQLVIKGLYRPETEIITIEVMTQLVDQIAHLRPAPSRALVTVMNAAGGEDMRGGRQGMGALLGPVEAQVALSLFSLLPWLCAHFRYSMHTPLASLCILAHANACRAIGLRTLAEALQLLSASSKADVPSLLTLLCPPLCSAFFSRYARLAIRRIMETLRRGDETLHPWALALLQAILQSPRLDIAPLAALADDPALFRPLSALLQGPLHQPALQVVEALATFQSTDVPQGIADVDSYDQPDCLSHTIKGSQAASAALETVADGWGTRKGQRIPTVMPFLERGISLADYG